MAPRGGAATDLVALLQQLGGGKSLATLEEQARRLGGAGGGDATLRAQLRAAVRVAVGASKVGRCHAVPCPGGVAVACTVVRSPLVCPLTHSPHACLCPVAPPPQAWKDFPSVLRLLQAFLSGLRPSDGARLNAEALLACLLATADHDEDHCRVRVYQLLHRALHVVPAGIQLGAPLLAAVADALLARLDDRSADVRAAAVQSLGCPRLAGLAVSLWGRAARGRTHVQVQGRRGGTLHVGAAWKVQAMGWPVSSPLHSLPRFPAPQRVTWYGMLGCACEDRASAVSLLGWQDGVHCPTQRHDRLLADCCLALP